LRERKLREKELFSFRHERGWIANVNNSVNNIQNVTQEREAHLLIKTRMVKEPIVTFGI
jgi:hypothetical protein